MTAARVTIKHQIKLRHINEMWMLKWFIWT